MGTYEKKYKEALELAQKLYQDCPNGKNDRLYHTTDLEKIFPELRESEDEKIKKEIISFIQDDIDEINLKVSGDYDDRDEDDIAHQNWCKKALSWLEKQGGEKPADKVEPKFKVGDWITDDEAIFHITSYDIDYGYQLETVNGTSFHYSDETLEKYRLWTIQDAKDGDVLCDYHEACDNPLIFILKKFECVNFGLVRPSDYSSYCFLTAGDIQKFKEGTYHHKHNIKPATKEQCDILFKKMKEAGYEWDAEKKELKKISQRMISAEAKEAMYAKPAWSEEDERLCSCLIKEQKESLDNLKNDKYGHSEIISDLKEMYRERIDWLKALKQRIGG